MGSKRVWRICHKRFAEEAFTGEGARLYGGRFNSEGRPAVYTSGSLSLALLEMLVRTNDRDYFMNCMLLHADIPMEMIREIATVDLPEGWDAVPYEPVSQAFGDQWLTERAAAVLKVPSVVIPVEFNYVINPLHVDFKKIEISKPDKMVFKPKFRPDF
jgi:RES domain-containing protein